jgi:hypothetical protein
MTRQSAYLKAFALITTETLPRGAKATATRLAKFAISRRCAQCRSGRRS